MPVVPPYPTGPAAQQALERALTPLAANMLGSRILAIASEVRGLIADGVDVCNLTVGDFAPEHFQPPAGFLAEVGEHMAAGRTNYPPSDGLPELRDAIAAFYERHLGVAFTRDNVVVGSGARPPLYAAYMTVLQPGDKLVYAVPSWNNEYYAYLTGAEAVQVQTRPEDGFMPTVESLRPHLGEARMLHLNSPLNPTGTAIDKAALTEIAQAVVDENARREADGRPSLMLLFDMVYWLLTYGDTEHHDPISLVPEVAPYCIYVDAISKCMAATGLRVGWGVVPPYMQGKIKALIGHTGAWAPRPEQMATAAFLNDDGAVDSWLTAFRGDLQARLDLIHERFEAMRQEGLPVRAIAPQGAIYLSVQLDLVGKTTPDGAVLRDNADIRRFLLHTARVAVVPFRAFGLEGETGWMRMSVGAVGMDALAAGMGRIHEAVAALR